VARRPSKHTRPVRPLNPSLGTSAAKHDGQWIVRTIAGEAAVRTYRCPGCLQSIHPGTPHIVSWPVEPGLLTDSGLEERRHWHTSCWERRR
jgi:hypothetical protein